MRRLSLIAPIALIALGLGGLQSSHVQAATQQHPSWTRCVTAGGKTTCHTYVLKHEHRQPVGKKTTCRQTWQRRVCETWPIWATPVPACSLNPNTGPDVLRWTSIVCRVSAQLHVNPRIIGAIIWQESRGENYANGGTCNTSTDGYASEGLMQLIPKTAAWVMGTTQAYATQALCDPTWNITAGASLYRYFLGYWHGDIFRAIESYNAGYNYWNGDGYARSVLAHS